MHSPSQDSAFTPRKEFLPDAKPLPNAFSLLAIAGSNLVRLYSFPPSVINAVRRVFEKLSLLTAFREDINLKFCELSLDGKPWNTSKSVTTEALLLEIISVLYHQGYSYVSTIEYGREQDDKLCIVLQKPSTAQPATHSSFSRTASPMTVSSASSTRKIPFAISFSSATVLRVISPPLHSTPAILQAVRSSWPRGVVSERKLGEGAYEFKLKGYKWFQEDTFAIDSLNYILSLLSSLDSHSFSLVSSISLSGRSRVKDLWIFTGPAASSSDQLVDSPVPSILNSPRAGSRAGSLVEPDSTTHHRFASTPNPIIPPLSHSPQHTRGSSESKPPTSSPLAVASPVSSTPNVLRKPAPKAQVPDSVAENDELEEKPEGSGDTEDIAARRDGEAFRLNLPSVIPEGAHDMTGVGTPSKTPDVFYATSPLGDSSAAPHEELSEVPTEAPVEGVAPIEDAPTDPYAPIVLAPLAHDLPPEESSAEQSAEPSAVTPPPLQHNNSGKLLSSGTFRDSTFSSFSDEHPEGSLPIMWNKNPPPSAMPDLDKKLLTPPGMPKRASSTGPILPGGWAPSPVKEEPDPVEMSAQGDEPQSTTPVREVPCRVASPEMKQVNSGELRKSEAGVVEMMATPPSDTRQDKENQASPPASTKGQGWVIVDVEGKRAAPPESPLRPVQSNVPASTDGIAEPSSPAVPNSPTPQLAEQSSMSAAAKTIAIIDAVDDKKNKSNNSLPARSPSPTQSSDSGKGRRRFFSLRKKPKEPKQPRKRMSSGLSLGLGKIGE